MAPKAVGEPLTGFMLDTNIFNRVIDGRFARDELPIDAVVIVTHKQVEEVASTPDAYRERRIQLLLALMEWRPVLAPTAMVWDATRWGHARWGDGKAYEALKAALDQRNGGKPNNVADALIAETAMEGRHTLVTADDDLAMVAAAQGGKVLKVL